MATFRGVTFDLLADGSMNVPLPVENPQTSELTLTSPVVIYSRNDYRTLFLGRCTVVWENALGSKAGYHVVTNGPGFFTLAVPTGPEGESQNYTAAIVNMAITKDEFSDGLYSGTITWAILSDPVPALD